MAVPPCPTDGALRLVAYSSSLYKLLDGDFYLTKLRVHSRCLSRLNELRHGS